LSAFFVDTSALAKRYIAEIGSSWIRGIVLPIAGNVVIIADLTLVEMFSLLARRGKARYIQAMSYCRVTLSYYMQKENT